MAHDARALFAGRVDRREVLVVLGLLALAVLVRSQAMTWPATDSDVGAYLIVARTLQHGILPYVTAWEYKPPGAFVPYALALAAFGSPGTAVLVLGDGAVFIAALIVRRMARGIDPERGAGIGTIAAVFLIFLSIENDGLVGDIELLAVPLTCGAIALLLPFERDRCSPWRYAAIGALAGAAVQLKLTSVPFALFVFAAIAWKERRGPLVPLLVSLATAAAPWAIEVAVYAAQGHLSLLIDANVGASLRRVASRSEAPARWQRTIAEKRILGPPIELALLAFLLRMRKLNLIYAWFVVGALSLIITNEYDARQYFMVVAPLCLLGAFALDRIGRWLGRPALVTGVFVVATFAMHDYYTVLQAGRYAYYHGMRHDSHWHQATIVRIADAIRPCVEAEPTLYVVRESPILYDMLDVPPPTRYIFATNLFDRSKWAMLGFDGSQELMRILRTKPATIVYGAAYEDPSMLRFMMSYVQPRYLPIQTVDRTVIYRLKSVAADGPPACRATELRPLSLAR